MGKSHKVGNLKMQPKKNRILQDESLEIKFKRNQHKKMLIQVTMKTSEKMTRKKWKTHTILDF